MFQKCLIIKQETKNIQIIRSNHIFIYYEMVSFGSLVHMQAVTLTVEKPWTGASSLQVKWPFRLINAWNSIQSQLTAAIHVSYKSQSFYQDGVRRTCPNRGVFIIPPSPICPVWLFFTQGRWVWSVSMVTSSVSQTSFSLPLWLLRSPAHSQMHRQTDRGFPRSCKHRGSLCWESGARFTLQRH